MRSVLLLLGLTGCAVSMESARAVQAEAKRQNEAAYRAALAEAGLTEAPEPAMLQTFERPPDPDDGEALIVGSWSKEMPSGPQGARFARDSEGRLWLIDARPSATSVETLKVRDCWRRYDGGITPAVYDVGYVLPEDVDYAGRKPVEYPARQVNIQLTQGPCETGPPKP